MENISINSSSNFINTNYPRIDLILGPMFSGKSTRLLHEAVKFSKAGFKVLYVNSRYDTRDVKNVFSTHNPVINIAYKENEENKDKKKLENKNLNFVYVIKLSEVAFAYDFDILIVDEGQFILDIYDTALYIVNKLKKRVIIGALDGSYNQETFGVVNRLIPWADSVIKLNAFCVKCSEKGRMVDAPFTSRKDKKNKEMICIGDTDKYIALCRECLLNEN